MKFIRKHSFDFFTTILVLGSFICLFLPCVEFDNGFAYQSTGYQIIFGQQLYGTKPLSTTLLSFSILAFLVLFLLILGIVLIWLNKIPFSRFFAGICIITGGILLLSYPDFASRASKELFLENAIVLPALGWGSALSTTAGSFVLMVVAYDFYLALQRRKVRKAKMKA